METAANKTVWKLGGGYYAVFEGNNPDPKIVYTKEKIKTIHMELKKLQL